MGVQRRMSQGAQGSRVGPLGSTKLSEYNYEGPKLN